MGLYQIISNSTNLNLYSSGFWNFVAGPSRAMCATDCQDNAALYQGNSRMHVYGFQHHQQQEYDRREEAWEQHAQRCGFAGCEFGAGP